LAAGLEELTALPRHPSWIKRSLLLREGDGKREEGGE